VTGGSSVTVTVHADGTEADFDAENFGGPGCESDLSRDNIPISGHLPPVQAFVRHTTDLHEGERPR
jgi:hypothetical protein